MSLVVPSFPSPPGLVAENVENKWWEGLKRREREREGGMDFGYKINWSFHPHLNTPRPPRKKGRKEEEKKNPDFLASSLYCAASSSLSLAGRALSRFGNDSRVAPSQLVGYSRLVYTRPSKAKPTNQSLLTSFGPHTHTHTFPGKSLASATHERVHCT